VIRHDGCRDEVHVQVTVVVVAGTKALSVKNSQIYRFILSTETPNNGQLSVMLLFAF